MGNCLKISHNKNKTGIKNNPSDEILSELQSLKNNDCNKKSIQNNNCDEILSVTHSLVNNPFAPNTAPLIQFKKNDSEIIEENIISPKNPNNLSRKSITSTSTATTKTECKSNTFTSLLFNNSRSISSFDSKIGISPYKLICPIHKSSSNIVYIISKQYDDKELYIYKKSINKTNSKISEIKSEYDVLSKCDNIFIEKMINICEDNQAIIKEYISGVTLDVYCKNNEKKNLYFIFYQVLLGVYYLHSHGIMHRDIKPSNIMITDDGIVKIIDFGFSTFNKIDNLQCGTSFYIAPEIWENRLYDNRVDVWSLGVLLYYILTQKFPYSGKIQREIYFNIIKSNFNTDVNLELDDIVLINVLLDKNIKRITVEKFLTLGKMQKLSKSYYEHVQNSNLCYNKKNKILSYIDFVNKKINKYST